MDTIGSRVKQIRDDHDMSQEAFGKKLGVKKAAISKIENNSRALTDPLLYSIVREFCVNETWLRDGLGNKYEERKRIWRKNSEEEIETFNEEMLSERDALFSLIKDSPEEEKAMLFTILKYMYSLLIKKKLNTSLYYTYYQQFGIIFMEFCNLIEELNYDHQEDYSITTSFIEKIKPQLHEILNLYNPEINNKAAEESRSYITAGYGTGKTYSLLRIIKEFDWYNGTDDAKTGLFDMYNHLGDNDQEEILTLMSLKLKRGQSIKRKRSLSNSEHGEEAATSDIVTKKMA